MNHSKLARIAERVAGEKTFEVKNHQVLVLKEKDVTVVAFRGTEFKFSLESIWDMLTSLTNDVTDDPICGKVHKGILKAAKSLVDKVYEASKGTTVILTGHSMGGGVALLMAPLLKAKGLTVNEVVTFGAVRAVTDILSTTAKYSSFKITQYEFVGDPIPTKLGGSYVAINPVSIGNAKKTNYKHHDIDNYIASISAVEVKRTRKSV